MPLGATHQMGSRNTGRRCRRRRPRPAARRAAGPATRRAAGDVRARFVGSSIASTQRKLSEPALRATASYVPNPAISPTRRRGTSSAVMRPCRRNGVTPFDTTQRFGNCRPSLLAVLDVLLNPAQACANKAARASPASVGMGRRTSQAPRVRCRRRRAMAGTPRPLDRAEMEPTALIAF